MATSMSTARTAAATGVRKPVANASPPRSSPHADAYAQRRGGRKLMRCAAPIQLTNPCPPKAPTTFCAPWPKSSSPVTTRKTASATGASISGMRPPVVSPCRSRRASAYGACCARVRPELDLLPLLHRAVLHPTAAKADARAPPSGRDPGDRAVAPLAPDHDDPPPGDDEHPRLPRGAVHRHRGLRGRAARDPIHAARYADRSLAAHAGWARSCVGADRVRAQTARGKGDGLRPPLRDVGGNAHRAGRRRDR